MPPWTWMASPQTVVRGLAHVGLGDRGGQRRVGGPSSRCPGGVVDGGVGVLASRASRPAVLDRLKRADRLAELLPHLGVVHGHVEAASRRAQHLGGRRPRPAEGAPRAAGPAAPGVAERVVAGPTLTSSRSTLGPLVQVDAGTGDSRVTPCARRATMKSVSPSGARAGTSTTSATCANGTKRLSPVRAEPVAASLGAWSSSDAGSQSSDPPGRRRVRRFSPDAMAGN